jgi:rod shape determining protein RodA
MGSWLQDTFSPRRLFDPAGVRWREVDWHILIVAAGIVALGLVFQGAMDAAEPVGAVGGASFAGHREKLLFATPLLLLGLVLRPSWLRRNAHRIFWLSILLLVALYFIGVERNNARRWIPLPHFDLQPSELAKIGLVLILSSLLSRRRLETWGEWVLPLAVVLLPLALVAAQPDLGTALTLLPIALGMFHLAGAPWRSLVGLCLIAASLGFLGWKSGLVQDYQLERIHTWTSSYEAPDLIEGRYGPAFHAYQARTALGNGGWTGTGLGQGVANGARTLPERDSDSVFAVMGEELGFLGSVGVLLLYSLLPFLLMISAARQRDRFCRLVVGGVALLFASHLVIHVAVNTGLVPMTGLPLPLISAGGSSLLASLLALGLALGLAAHHGRSLDRDTFRSY